MAETTRTLDEVLYVLEHLTGDDPEAAHSVADELLLEALRAAGHASIADAYDSLVERSRWWATA